VNVLLGLLRYAFDGAIALFVVYVILLIRKRVD
jgi:hypothetical protein